MLRLVMTVVCAVMAMASGPNTVQLGKAAHMRMPRRSRLSGPNGRCVGWRDVARICGPPATMNCTDGRKGAERNRRTAGRRLRSRCGDPRVEVSR